MNSTMIKKTFFSLLLISAVIIPLNAQFKSYDPTVSSESSVNWINKTFSTVLSLSNKEGIITPSDRAGSEVLISNKMAYLVKDPLLSLYVDSANTLGDIVLQKTITNEKLTAIINGSTIKPGIYTTSMSNVTINASFNLDNVGSLMIMHNNPYTPIQPIEVVSSRTYTGIIIDARGTLSVQGEFVTSPGYPCFFPKIWDDTMELLYERNMMNSKTAKDQGIVTYACSDDESLYRDRIGNDPLHISARRIFGTNRTDPVISRKDALRILSVPENLELLKEGRIVILLDEDVLVHSVSAPVKTKSYYTKYRELEQFVYTNKIPAEVTEENDGIHISIEDLNFYPDSEILLPKEAGRLDLIAEKLVSITQDNEYTILVEGHTAAVGKPTGEMNLSYLRALTIIEELVTRGVNRDICEAKGYGGTKPIGDNTTEEGRAKNRRVEIIIQPKTSYVQTY
ncbi:MAG: OmpA family protein [Treponemataceae bacterium]|nr:OmpA family protein [Treponemataceae bacterium]